MAEITTHRDALRLYERLGFVVAETLPLDYRLECDPGLSNLSGVDP
ncbi:MAG: hypothetical protein ABSD78_13370 [Acidimicrobiales bacterium]|jgi:hypothetical protein